MMTHEYLGQIKVLVNLSQVCDLTPIIPLAWRGDYA